MNISPSHYLNTTYYKVFGFMTIKSVLVRKDFFHECYYVKDEGDDPVMIKDSIAYLRTQRGNKKIWVLQYETETGLFSDD